MGQRDVLTRQKAESDAELRHTRGPLEPTTYAGHQERPRASQYPKHDVEEMSVEGWVKSRRQRDSRILTSYFPTTCRCEGTMRRPHPGRGRDCPSRCRCEGTMVNASSSSCFSWMRERLSHSQICRGKYYT